MSKTKVYEGVLGGRNQILVDGRSLEGGPLAGFEWGLASGRTEAALHILVDCVGAELAVKHYQNFHVDVVGKMASNFTLTSDDIEHWLQSYGVTTKVE